MDDNPYKSPASPGEKGDVLIRYRGVAPGRLTRAGELIVALWPLVVLLLTAIVLSLLGYSK